MTAQPFSEKKETFFVQNCFMHTCTLMTPHAVFQDGCFLRARADWD